MKTIRKPSNYGLILLLVIALCLPLFSFKKGSCETEDMVKEAVDRLKKFTLLQNFPFYIKKKKKNDGVEHKTQIITLNRGVRYKFYAIRNNDYDGQPIVTIYNNEKLEFLLGTTYNSNSKKFYNELEFECKTTGNYCLAYSFHEGLEGCAIGVFSSLIKE